MITKRTRRLALVALNGQLALVQESCAHMQRRAVLEAAKVHPCVKGFRAQATCLQAAIAEIEALTVKADA